MNIENSHHSLQEFADVIAVETERCHTLKNHGDTVSIDGITHKFSLPEYIDALQALNIRQLLDSDFLEQKIHYFRQNIMKFKQKFPRGSKVTVAILPCNANGSIYGNEEIKQGLHIVLFLVDPQTGLSMYGDTLPALLPAEVSEKCSFIVEYGQESVLITQEEFAQFEQKLRQAFANLRALLLNSNKQLN